MTIGQVVATQVSTNQLMGKLTWVFLAIIVVVGGAGIANAMYANVAERRREIATLMALGASRSQVSGIFLLKALVLGLAGEAGEAGEAGGYLLGTAAAVAVGPQVASITVLPIAWLAPAAVLGTAAIALLAAGPDASCVWSAAASFRTSERPTPKSRPWAPARPSPDPSV